MAATSLVVPPFSSSMTCEIAWSLPVLARILVDGGPAAPVSSEMSAPSRASKRSASARADDSVRASIFKIPVATAFRSAGSSTVRWPSHVS